jgi:hypothetical protein
MLQRTTRQDDGCGLLSGGNRPTSDPVAVKPSRSSYGFAQSLVKEGHIVLDGRDAWSEHRPTAPQESESDDIDSAAAHLHGMLEAKR